VRGSVATCRAGPGPHSAARTPEQNPARQTAWYLPKNPAPLYPRPPRHRTRPPAPHPHSRLPTAPRRTQIKEPALNTPHAARPSRRPRPGGRGPGGPPGGEGRPTTPAPPPRAGTAAGVRRAERAANTRRRGRAQTPSDVTPVTPSHPPRDHPEAGGGGTRPPRGRGG
jgi:hypothetical protein